MLTRLGFGISRTVFRGLPRRSLVKSYSSNPGLKPTWRARLAQLDALFITGMTRFHEITGYAEIEKMKQELLVLEDRVGELRKSVKEARDAYNERLANRSSSQREMNELLMRKQTWLPEDLDRFTQLYKNDHHIQQAVMESKAKYDEVESELDDVQQQAAKLIGSRYREEQLWSDRIRQASTWGTWVLMGINLFLFVIVQLILEPWKRRRLVRSFEAKVQDMLDEKHESLALPTPAEPVQNVPMGRPLDQGITEPAVPLEWASLPSRLLPNGTLPHAVELRPVEAGALALASGLTLTGAVWALATLLQ